MRRCHGSEFHQAKNAHERMLAHFAMKYDILAPDMVAKGWTLTAANYLALIRCYFHPRSFQAFERVSALVTQVVGQAGAPTGKAR